MSAEEHEQDFTTEEQFEAHFMDLAMQWQDLGISPDDFLKCALCHEFLFDPDNGFELRGHCQKTTYVIKTSSGIEHGRVLPGQGGRMAADKEARKIRGRLFGIDIEGNEVRIAFYDLIPPQAR